MKNVRRCQNCGHIWHSKKKRQLYCPRCHSKNFQAMTVMDALREIVKFDLLPYRKNWGKPERIKRVSTVRKKSG